jgi:hypothetical protein
MTAQLADLERRLALLEQRLDPDADWERSTTGDGNEMVALDWLFDEFHRGNGSRVKPAPDDFEGEPFVDIMKGYIRPVTWSQLLDALRVVALDHENVVEKISNLAAAVDDIREWVSILSRLNLGTTSSADIANAYVLGVTSDRICRDSPKRVDTMRTWWKIIRLWGDLGNTPVGEERSRTVKQISELEEELTEAGAAIF